MSATVYPLNADYGNVWWQSDDESVAKVYRGTGNSCYVEPKSEGTTIITAYAGNKKAECVVTVRSVTVDNITLDKYTLSFKVGDGEQLTATVVPDGVPVTWRSDDPYIANVSEFGYVFGEGEGTTNIYASAGDKVAMCVVTVSPQDVGGDVDDANNFVIEENGNNIVLTKYTGAKTSVTIPSGVTQIGSEAFTGNTGIKTVTIPATVCRIEERAFEGCENLDVKYVGTLADWCNIENDYYLMSNANSVMLNNGDDLKAISELHIPEDVESIAMYAFKDCANIETVELANVKIIGWGAFSGCTALDGIVIPDSVITISSVAFSDCTNLSNVTMSNSITIIEAYMFSGCANLDNVEIPEKVTTIWSYAFKDCDALTKITIPNSVDTIEQGAFINCKQLEEIEIPTSVTTIGENAFSGCSSLDTVKYEGTQEDWNNIELGENTGLEDKMIIGKDDATINYKETEVEEPEEP